MRYFIYIKSHCEAPDFEEEVEANSKKEAIRYFLHHLNKGEGGWDESMIENAVISEKEMK